MVQVFKGGESNKIMTDIAAAQSRKMLRLGLRDVTGCAPRVCFLTSASLFLIFSHWLSENWYPKA
jgi:hypothetical protein